MRSAEDEWASICARASRSGRSAGGPDRRFSNNPRIPICLYDELHFRTASGLNEVVQLSRSGIGEGFAAALRHLGSIR